MNRVLFVCTNNSARSQMAEGLTNTLLSHRYRASSAGTRAKEVNPLAIKVMAEIGIDISNTRSKNTEEFTGEPFELVVTLCNGARDECPLFPGAKKYLHAPFKDPASVGGTEEDRLAFFRAIRDEIKTWLLNEL